MNSFRARRISLSQAKIFDNQDVALSSITWPTVHLWSCENTTIGDPYEQDKSLGSYPKIEINGRELLARRKLLTENFFGNQYSISLWDENGKSPISATTPKWNWQRTEISYKDQTYFLIRKSRFRFHFVLEHDGAEAGRFTEVTSFFTFSSYREFLLSFDRPVDPLLMTFGFFFAHNGFF